MEQVIDEPEVRAGLIEAMREQAERGKSVPELVRYVQSELGLKHDTVLSVLWYFMKAFRLPLDEVLPIREWLATGDEEEINAIVVPAIQRAKSTWSGKE